MVVEGESMPCLTIADINGCPSTTCDSFYVDANGGVPPGFVPCTACIDVVPATDGPAGPLLPWTVFANNCSTGGPSQYTYNISWGDGEDNGPNPHVYTQPGGYMVCITMTSANGCASVACDSVYVDDDGTIDPAAPCNAGFWVMQAYETDSLNPNVGQPIPNELWVWNLSSGGSGNYQFFWDFGDGTSSTDPFPTHFYANGGPYQLCLTLFDSNGCEDTACDSVSVDDNGIYTGMILEDNYARSGFTIRVLNLLPTSIAEAPAFDNTALWPNPVDEVLNLSFNTTMNGNVPMSIIDLNGRVASSTNVRLSLIHI